MQEVTEYMANNKNQEKAWLFSWLGFFELVADIAPYIIYPYPYPSHRANKTASC